MRPILLLLVIGPLVAAAAGSAEAQFTKRVTERIKQKVEERKLQTEETAVSRAAEPADSAMSRISAPVESLAARVGGGAAAAVGGLGRGTDGIQREAARLRDQLAAGPAHLPSIRFEPGTAALSPSSDSALQALAMALADLPGVFLIQGRADSGVSQAEGLQLGASRAGAIKAWLVGKGIPPEQVFAAGDGVAVPDGPQATVTPMQ